MTVDSLIWKVWCESERKAHTLAWIIVNKHGNNELSKINKTRYISSKLPDSIGLLPNA